MCCSHASQNGQRSRRGAFGLRNEAGYAKPRLRLPENLRSFCTGCGSMVPNSNGHQRRLPSNQHSKLSNSRRPRRDPRSLPGRWRWCDRPWLCDAQTASALHTLIHQRHPTPSCGGHAPTAERTMIPAKMCSESLDRRPGIREQPGSKADLSVGTSAFALVADTRHRSADHVRRD